MEIEIHELPPAFDFSKGQLQKIVKAVTTDLSLKALSITVIFVTDSYLAKMHNQYLNDPGKTDVLTFNLGDNEIEGEIYISYERALEQAKTYSVSGEEEIVRLVIHGILHLAGFDDINENDRLIMKGRENQLVDKYSGII